MIATWTATHDDGSTVTDDYARIDRRQLRLFEVNWGQTERLGRFRLLIPKGESLVYRKRTAASGSGEAVELLLVACIRSDGSCSTLAELYWDPVLRRPLVKFHPHWGAESAQTPKLKLYPPTPMECE